MSTGQDVREVTEGGFDFKGRFYPWHVSDMGKDLMLIDRFAAMSVVEFFELLDDDVALERGPVLLTLVATSMRHAHPEWSVDKVARTVMNLSLSEIEFVSSDVEDEGEEGMRPPSEAASSTPSESDEPSRSPLNGSSPSSTPEASSDSETSYASPV